MKVLKSERDSDGRLWIACSECRRGGNGDLKHKCACGFDTKVFNGLGCFTGELLIEYRMLI